ncbi:MAG: division/cell wall cluster transcriptional repressor MraZ [Alphaproteobacteria bacterium]|nr:division/cell wall cluster transcriptional repressor MraZ [Alphaproteobacteria bacterium]MBV9694630.1 division/cell wall cluster transcriptional repressor MraZ [Alphaproteobacteria bacterium]
MAAPFISTMTGTLDAKGRVCIPAPFRDVLTAQDTAGLYVCPSFAEPALEGFGDEVLQDFHRRQAEADPFFSPAVDDKVFAVLSMSQLLPRDENGRVRLPDEMIAHAGLKDRVTFVGMGRKFQIWDSERFAPVQAERLRRALAARNAGFL